jgi:hypothetical protein
MVALSALAAVAVAVSPAEAAKKKRSTIVYTQGQTRVVAGRAPARIVVRGRSYLDAGTEVIPGERKFTDYVYPPGYDPLTFYGADPRGGYVRQPLPGPFDLPGFQR